MKAVQHARHGQVYRMANEDAALLVSSGRYVYISKFQAREAAMKPRRHTWPARIAVLGAAVVAILALLMLTTSAQARPCESLATVQAKHPGQHAKYRSVDGRKCWYAGKRVPAKSEFKIAHDGSKPTSVGQHNGPRRPPVAPADGRTVGSIPATGATYHEQINDAFLALCGGICPQMLTFGDRWVLR